MYERRKLTLAGTCLLGLLGILVSLFAPNDAMAFFAKEPARDKIGGTIRATIDGKSLYFPTLKSDISASIDGDIAMVTVTQTFLNPTKVPLNASYLFPLNKDAAVHFMMMEMGEERITAVIRKKAEARATFEKAKSSGRAAALLNQHRPNMFTQELANLMPGTPVKVTLKYAMAVPRIDGAYELVVPLVVGPRFTPVSTPVARLVRDDNQAVAPVKNGEWSFDKAPEYPEVSGLHIPDQVAKDRVSINIELKAALPLKAVRSATHLLLIEGEQKQKKITLAAGRIIDNRDFVLRYELAGKSVAAGLMAHKDQRGDFFSLLVEPPKAPLEKDITPREMVFVLDTSGSMSGMPMEASKTFMRHAINSLRARDFFRVIRFANDTGEFSASPVPATMLNKVAGIKYVNSLVAGGGTRIPAAIEQAFGIAQQPGTLRIVTFLSDGYIGNEARVLNLIAQKIGKARIYAFGVGTSVNRFLLSEMARKGRGFARYIDPTENVNEVAIELASRLEAPVLTDIKIDWGTLQATSITPSTIPDLFKGDSLRLMAKSGRSLEAGSTHTVVLRGMSNGRKATMPLQLTIPQNLDGQSSGSSASDMSASALPVLWARTRIADHMRSLMTPHQMRLEGQSDEKLTQLVTRLGLDYSLMSQWTSFVAVSEKIVNEHPGASIEASVPLNQIKGVLEHAYRKKTQASPDKRQLPAQHKARMIINPAQTRIVALNGAAGSQRNFGFGGSSTPEPGTIGGMILLVLMMLSGLAWSRRNPA